MPLRLERKIHKANNGKRNYQQAMIPLLDVWQMQIYKICIHEDSELWFTICTKASVLYEAIELKIYCDTMGRT